MPVKKEELVLRIVREQELVIGPLAWREAKKVSGLQVGEDGQVKVSGSFKIVLQALVQRYEGLFGPASVDVCREAVKGLLPDVPKEDVPDVLR